MKGHRQSSWTFLALATAVSIATPVHTASHNCHISFCGPQDLVLIIDTSGSFHMASFNKSRELFEHHILQRHVNLHPDYTRLAVISFAEEDTTLLDFVSGTERQPTANEFFSAEGLWRQRVLFNESKGENVQKALSRAARILEAGRQRRPAAAGSVWIATDWHEFNTSDRTRQIKSLLDGLHQQRVEVFGVGRGRWHNESQSAWFRSHMQEPVDCHYKRYEDWMSWLNQPASHHPASHHPANTTDAIGQGEYVLMENGVRCRCEEFNVTHPLTCGDRLIEIVAGGGSPMDLAVISGVFGVVFAALCVTALVCLVLDLRHRRSRQKPNRNSRHLDAWLQQNSVGDGSSMGDAYVDPSMWVNPGDTMTTRMRELWSDGPTNDRVYENGFVPELLRAHLSSEVRPPPPTPTLSETSSVYNYEKAVCTCKECVSAVTGSSQTVLGTCPYSRQLSHHSYLDIRSSQGRPDGGFYEILSYKNTLPGSRNKYDDLTARPQKPPPPPQRPITSTIAARFMKYRQAIASAFDRKGGPSQQESTAKPAVPTVSGNVERRQRKYKANSKAEKAKRNSASVGTVRFKTLLAKFNGGEDRRVEGESGAEESPPSPAPTPPRPQSALDKL